MKNTFLIYVEKDSPEKGLRIASKAEWKQIMNDNKELPSEQKRYFIKDCIDDGSDIDGEQLLKLVLKERYAPYAQIALF